MNAKLWIVIFGAAFAVFIFHHALRADEKPQAASNVFLDEGEADYEMPKTEADKGADATTENKVSSKKTKKNEGGKNPRVPAANLGEEDDDQAGTGTKGDAFDQMQNPEAAHAPAPEKKAPVKNLKNSKDLTQNQKANKKLASAKQAETLEMAQASAPQAAPKAEMEIKMKPKSTGHRKLASAPFKQGFKETNGGDCVMYTGADKTSAQILVIKGSKKLWVEQNGDWYKAYHKKGAGFISAECF